MVVWDPENICVLFFSMIFYFFFMGRGKLICYFVISVSFEKNGTFKIF